MIISGSTGTVAAGADSGNLLSGSPFETIGSRPRQVTVGMTSDQVDTVFDFLVGGHIDCLEGPDTWHRSVPAITRRYGFGSHRDARSEALPRGIRCDRARCARGNLLRPDPLNPLNWSDVRDRVSGFLNLGNVRAPPPVLAVPFGKGATTPTGPVVVGPSLVDFDYTVAPSISSTLAIISGLDVGIYDIYANIYSEDATARQVYLELHNLDNGIIYFQVLFFPHDIAGMMSIAVAVECVIADCELQFRTGETFTAAAAVASNIIMVLRQ